MLRRASPDYDGLILAADIGGTNTRLAIVAKQDNSFRILGRFQTATPEHERFEDVLTLALQEMGKETDLRELSLCCISAAGPVVNDECRLTNAPWTIRRNSIEQTTGVRTYLVNDFSAISYALPLLDRENPDQVLDLPTVEGNHAVPQEGIAAVVGAGTGLGVGFIATDNGSYRAWPSEGGHTDLTPCDERTDALVRHLRAELGGHPDWEHVVSGAGIANVFGFLRTHEFSDYYAEIVNRVLELPARERAAQISAAAHHDPLCRATMEFFVELYARAAAGVALQLLPTAGLYLGGGIAPKNLRFFTEEHRFMRSFCGSFHAKFRNILSYTPVSIITDPEVSLYGAAHAATTLDRVAAADRPL